jgi:hypothetical protein
VDLVEVVQVIVLVLEDQEIHLQQVLLKEIMEELVISRAYICRRWWWWS